jgi:hypothetical protein
MFYTVINLTYESRIKLRKYFSGKYKNKEGNKIVLNLNSQAISDNEGKFVKFIIYGYGFNKVCEGCSVLLNDIYSESKVPHITISYKDNAKIEDVDNMLYEGHNAIEPIELNGTIKTYKYPENNKALN